MIQSTTPDKVFAELFVAVQTSGIFSDSKSFVDAIPKSDPADILKSYRENCQSSKFDLCSFVTSNFEFQDERDAAVVSETRRPVRQHIEHLWDVLTRAADTKHPNSSLISLPNPYIVPGGRFREIYYWDSYFTMLGLAESGRFDMIEDMVDNFAFLIDEIGFIPNGNRSYFCTRSQPPFFVLMVELLADVRNDPSLFHKYLPQLRREYEFWMAGASSLAEDGQAADRVIKLGDGFLNRYWDDSDEPRQESFTEDRERAKKSSRGEREFYRNIRAGCESGWDFSSRWLGEDASLESIRTTNILPLDLNGLLYRLETDLARVYKETGNVDESVLFTERAKVRKHHLQTLFFESKSGYYVEVSLPNFQPTAVPSLAAAYLLFLEIATPDQAKSIVDMIQDKFLAPGGWLTTGQTSGEQWDAPNGWAPLQWIVFDGFRRYGYEAEADIGARRWMENNVNVYRQTGRLLEKYDVEHVGSIATGGEYVVQDGFGWTNAILLKLLNHFREQ